MNQQFEFHKRRRFFIGMHNETLSIVAMRVHDPDCSSLAVEEGWDPRSNNLWRHHAR